MGPFAKYLKKFINPAGSYKLWLFIAAVTVCLILSMASRYNQKRQWDKYPGAYYVHETPMMTTLDAFLFLRYAREEIEHKYVEGSHDLLRDVPNNNLNRDKLPFISYLLTKLAPYFNGNLHVAGNYLVIVSGSLFIIPLMLYFYSIGLPAAGIIGAIAGSFGYIYLARTSIGRIDTDCLNIFFPFLTSYFILLSTREKSLPRAVVYALLSCAAVYVFILWHEHVQFAYIYGLVFIASLLLNHIGRMTSRQIYLLVFVSLLALAAVVVSVVAIKRFSLTGQYGKLQLLAGVYRNLMFYFNAFYDELSNTGLRVQKGIFLQVTELQKTPARDILSYVFTAPGITAFGLGAYFVFLVTHFRKLLPLSPIFVLGMLSFAGSNRMVIFMAPFAGIGYGYLIHVLLAMFSERFKAAERFKIKGLTALEIATYAVTALFAAVLMQWQVAFSYVPQPSVDTGIYSSFEEIKNKIPVGAAIYTWWDLGYAIEDVIGAATVIDGGVQRKVDTLYIANSLVNSKQPLLYNTAVMATGGGLAKGDILSRRAEESVLAGIKKKDVYILFTRDMISKLQAIYSVSGISSGRNLSISDLVLARMDCQSVNDGTFICGQNRIDIKNGILNGNTPIVKTILAEKGGVGKEVTYFRPAGSFNGYYVLLLMDKKQINDIYLLNELAFNSNFVQMFLVGKYDANLFDLVYDNRPAASLYRVKDSVK